MAKRHASPSAAPKQPSTKKKKIEDSATEKPSIDYELSRAQAHEVIRDGKRKGWPVEVEASVVDRVFVDNYDFTDDLISHIVKELRSDPSGFILTDVRGAGYYGPYHALLLVDRLKLKIREELQDENVSELALSRAALQLCPLIFAFLIRHDSQCTRTEAERILVGSRLYGELMFPLSLHNLREHRIKPRVEQLHSVQTLSLAAAHHAPPPPAAWTPSAVPPPEDTEQRPAAALAVQPLQPEARYPPPEHTERRLAAELPAASDQAQAITRPASPLPAATAAHPVPPLPAVRAECTPPAVPPATRLDAALAATGPAPAFDVAAVPTVNRAYRPVAAAPPAAAGACPDPTVVAQRPPVELSSFHPKPPVQPVAGGSVHMKPQALAASPVVKDPRFKPRPAADVRALPTVMDPRLRVPKPSVPAAAAPPSMTHHAAAQAEAATSLKDADIEVIDLRTASSVSANRIRAPAPDRPLAPPVPKVLLPPQVPPPRAGKPKEAAKEAAAYKKLDDKKQADSKRVKAAAAANGPDDKPKKPKHVGVWVCPPEWRNSGRYPILAGSNSLGEGGFGKVFRCADLLIRSREVAKKRQVLQTEDRGVPNRYILREVAGLSACHGHDHVVELLDVIFNPVSKPPYVDIVLPLAAASLDRIIRRAQGHGGLDVLTAKTIMSQIIDDLTWIHECGWVHLDLKPNNVLVYQDYTCKITDFGLSRPHTTTVRLHPPVGTLGYRPPEELFNLAYSRPSMDIWPLGTIYAEMRKARAIFDTSSHMACFKSMIDTVGTMLPNVFEQLAPDYGIEGSRYFVLRKQDISRIRYLHEDERQFVLRCWTLEPLHRPTAKKLAQDPFWKRFPTPDQAKLDFLDEM
ncbi:hypothetical protein V8E36_004716 [Tilletia maclaganii]